MKAAVERVGEALFISGKKEDLTTAVNTCFQSHCWSALTTAQVSPFSISWRRSGESLSARI